MMTKTFVFVREERTMRGFCVKKRISCRVAALQLYYTTKKGLVIKNSSWQDFFFFAKIVHKMETTLIN